MINQNIGETLYKLARDTSGRQDFMDSFMKSGKFEASIPYFDVKETPKDGEYRKHKGYVWQYDGGKYHRTLRIFDNEAKPENGEFVLKGNSIFRYNGEDGKYYREHEIPSKFMSAKEPSLYETPVEWAKTTLPKSVKRFGRGVMPTQVGSPEYKDGKFTKPEFTTPTATPIQHTQEAAKRGAMFIPEGIVNDVAELTGLPFIMRFLNNPKQSIDRDPMGAGMAIVALAGMAKGGAKAGARKVVEGMGKGDFVSAHISNIPKEVFSKFGLDKGKTIAKIRREGAKRVSSFEGMRGQDFVGEKPPPEAVASKDITPATEMEMPAPDNVLSKAGVSKPKQPWEMTKEAWMQSRPKPSFGNDSVTDMAFVSQTGKPGLSIEGTLGVGGKVQGDPALRAIVYRDANGKPVGTVTYHTKDAGGALETRADYGALVSAYVRPEFQRRGIASKMFEFAKENGINFDKVEGMSFTEPGGMFFHKESVKQAISEGKSVPPEVLAEYPDLKAASKPESLTPSTEPKPSSPFDFMGEKPPTIKPSKYSTGQPKLEPIVKSKELESASVELAPKERGAVGKAIDKLFPAPTELGRVIGESMRRRMSRYNRGEFLGEKAMDSITEGMSESQRSSVPFIIEGTKDLGVIDAIGRSDVRSVIETKDPKAMIAAERTGYLFDKDKGFIRKNYDSKEFVDHYVSQMWDIPKTQYDTIINYFGQHNPFLKKRTIPSLEEGIKLGLKPKTTDIKEIYSIYNRYKNKIAVNNELNKTLRGTQDEFGRPLIVTTKPKFGLGKMDVATGYKTVHHPMFPNGKAFVHPDLYDGVSSVLETTSTEGLSPAFETINHSIKYINLAATLFHQGALSESLLGYTSPYGVGKGIGSSIRHMATDKYYQYERPALASDAIENSVKIGVPKDVNLTLIDNALENIIGKTKGPVKAGAKGVKWLYDKNNKFLWDHLQTTYKLMGYEKGVATALAKATKRAGKEGRVLSKQDIKNIKQEVGSFINDSFGGQNWDILGQVLANKNMQKSLHNILLAPDWTISVIRQFTAPYRGMKGIEAGKALNKAGYDIQGQKMLDQGRALSDVSTAYWKKMYAYAMLITQTANWATTQKVYGKGRLTFDNAPGHELHIFMGRGGFLKNKEGEQEEYLRFGKQMTEPWRWLSEPLNVLGSKLSPFLRGIIPQLTKHEAGSGYPTSFADEEGFDIGKRAGHLAQSVLPFSMRGLFKRGGGTYLLMYPKVSGMTPQKTRDSFIRALMMDDESLKSQEMERIAYHAQQNGVEWRGSLMAAEQSVKRKALWGASNYLAKFNDEAKKLKTPEEQVDLIDSYFDSGALTAGQARSVISKLDENQTVMKRFSEMKEEREYIKRITSAKNINARKEYIKLRDNYDYERVAIRMLYRQGLDDKARERAMAWNRGAEGRLAPIAKESGVSLQVLSGSPLKRNYMLTPEKMINIKKSKDDERYTELEKLIGEEIK